MRISTFLHFTIIPSQCAIVSIILACPQRNLQCVFIGGFYSQVHTVTNFGILALEVRNLTKLFLERLGNSWGGGGSDKNGKLKQKD